MKKRLIRLIAFVTAALMMVSILAACGGNSEETAAQTSAAAASSSASATETKSIPEEVTLKFILPPATPNDLDLVVAEFEKRTKDTLNTKLEFNFVSFDDVGQKVSVKLAAGEAIDGVFSAQWTNPSIMQNVSKGLLVNLDKYFHNDEYPGLKSAFSKAYLDNNSFADGTGEKHVYAIPFTHGFDQGQAVYYRQDLAEKYGISEIKDYDDLVAYFDAIAKNEKGMVPFGWLGSVNSLSGFIFGGIAPTTQKHNYNYSIGAPGGAAVIKDDGTAYLANNYFYLTDPDYLASLPEPLNTIDPYQQYAIAREWYEKGYIEKDVLSQKDPEGMFKVGKFGSYLRDISVYNQVVSEVEASIPGAKIGCYVASKAIRENLKGQTGSNFQCWNFVSVPVTSKNADRTMKFFDWIFADRANHDLFEYGIEGKHWNAIGDDKYKIPDGVDAAKNYNLVGFQLCWNPGIVRYSADTPDNIVEINKRLGNSDFYYKDITAGFSFAGDSVKSEVAKLNEIISQAKAVECGLVADYKAEIQKLQKKMEQAGFSKVREEASKQFNEFLKSNPYQGQ